MKTSERIIFSFFAAAAFFGLIVLLSYGMVRAIQEIEKNGISPKMVFGSFSFLLCWFTFYVVLGDRR